MSVRLPIPPMAIPNNVLPGMNGNMPDNLLVWVDDIQVHIYVETAWQEFKRYVRDAYGWELGATEGYRDYATQRLYFLSRYTTRREDAARDQWGNFIDVKNFEGRTYYIRPGFALAAVPRTSNHGLGLAIDACELVTGAKIKLTDARVANLVECAHNFFFGWEVQSEPWHIRYTLGWPCEKVPEAPIEPPPPIIEPEEPEVAASHIIQSNNPYWAKLIRFDNGNVIHVGPGEFQFYIDKGLPTFTESDEVAYLRLLEQSGTEWRP